MHTEIEIPDEIPTLRTISEADWSLIEEIVELSMKTGDVELKNANLTTERLRQLVEMPGAAVQALITHLAVLRLPCLVDALDISDTVAPILTTWLDHLGQADEQVASRRELQQEAAARAERWAAAQADPAGTLQRLQELEGDQLAQAALLGVGGSKVSNRNRGDKVRARAAELLLLTAPEPEPQDPLITQAIEDVAGARQPTTLQRLAAWEKRNPYGTPGNDWRLFFRWRTDFAPGRQAWELIACATGATVAEVEAHAADVAAREELERQQIAEGYGSADELLRDARDADGWPMLSVRLGVAAELLQERLLRLLQPRQANGTVHGA